MVDKQPEEKDGLFERIKKILEPILWIIGVVTTLIAFYELWKGNQALVIYVFAGIVFLSLLIALGWVGFIKKETPKRGKRKATKIPFHKDYPKIARIGFILLIVLATYSLFQNQRAHEKYLAERENKLIVLIVGFDVPEKVDHYGLRNEIVKNLNANFSEDENIEIISIDEIITVSKGSEYARQLGEDYLADIVIWGSYLLTENPNIRINIENLSPAQLLPLKESETFQPVTTLSELETVSFQQQAGEETSALISFLAGFIEYQSENYESAIRYFDSSLETLPVLPSLFENRLEIYFCRGTSNSYLGQYERAIQDYNQAIQIRPQLAEAYYNRGLTYYYLGEYEDAIQDYGQAIQINPQFAEAYYKRGVVYDNLGQYEDAIQDYNQAIQINSQFAEFYYNRGVVYNDLGQYERAIQDYDQTIQIDPQFAMAYYNRGVTYSYLGEYEQAIQNYDQAIKINPQDIQAYNNRGNAYTDLGQYERAIQDFNKAIQINSQYANAYANRGVAYSYLGNYERAIQDFDKAIEINSQLAFAYYNRGLSYKALGKIDETESDFAKFKELTGLDVP